MSPGDNPVPKPKPKTKAAPVPTEYVVLERIDTGRLDVEGKITADVKAWIEVGTETTRGKGAAIKAVVGDRGGVFKAVPASSWRGGVERTQETIFANKPLD